MKILVVSGYPAWNKVSKGLMPSHHLYGVHELVDHYEDVKGSIRGILKKGVLGGGYVDFYLWNSDKKKILHQVHELQVKSKEYDVIYDQLNRCSIYLGLLKKIGFLKCKLITILHHPPYDMQLHISDSDAYIFFNEDYKNLAEYSNQNKRYKYYINKWRPDVNWYNKILNEENNSAKGNTFYIDTGKSKRDRTALIEAAKRTRIRVDYAGDINSKDGYARSYAVNLKDDIGMIKRISKYNAEIIPVLKNQHNIIGPLGITSFLDCIALTIPVIASDNVCFAKEIIKYGLGLLYKTDNSDDLAAAMVRLKTDTLMYDNCRKNMKLFQNKTIDDYSKVFVNILLNVENKCNF